MTINGRTIKFIAPTGGAVQVGIKLIVVLFGELQR